ncbi:hypothetical protein BHWA1_00022 [Brachyspira hyodysenteriae WA1]|uniref:Uncharacterized protein n=1 Tax=Brachyspira hyodysenteriae (strain ATCC 49526 / WA1) TaxID=565034 RepID=A0A3B6V8B2_BRAHW|nr:hypothetical protein BHWA1_00022 [Brachyspira hyodysenteriae WA1]
MLIIGVGEHSNNKNIKIVSVWQIYLLYFFGEQFLLIIKAKYKNCERMANLFAILFWRTIFINNSKKK